MKVTVAQKRLVVLAAIVNFGVAIPKMAMREERNIPAVTTPAETSLQTITSPAFVLPIFSSVDADKNNSISFNEFTKVLSARDPQMVKEMFQLFDTDVDHQLNEDEYSRFIQDMDSYFSQTNDEVFKRFESMDTNNDQLVDLQEFKNWIEQNGGQTDLYEKLFKLSDSNGDQKISFAEFISEN